MHSYSKKFSKFNVFVFLTVQWHSVSHTYIAYSMKYCKYCLMFDVSLVDWHKLTYLVLTCRKTPINWCFINSMISCHSYIYCVCICLLLIYHFWWIQVSYNVDGVCNFADAVHWSVVEVVSKTWPWVPIVRHTEWPSTNLATLLASGTSTVGECADVFKLLWSSNVSSSMVLSQTLGGLVVIEVYLG